MNAMEKKKGKINTFAISIIQILTVFIMFLLYDPYLQLFIKKMHLTSQGDKMNLVYLSCILEFLSCKELLLFLGKMSLGLSQGI